MRTGRKPPGGQGVKGEDDARGQYALYEVSRRAIGATNGTSELGGMQALRPFRHRIATGSRKRV